MGLRYRTFERSIELPVSAERAFRWHARPGAFERLAPPWQRIAIRERSGGIASGDRLSFVVGRWPVRLQWDARHEEYVEGCQFVDVQDRGPFAFWRHTHRIEPVSGDRCVLTDHVEYRLPLERAGGGVADRMIRRTLHAMFNQRHHVTAGDLRMHAAHAERPRQTVAISGATGFVGSTLAAMLSTGGHEVRRIIRPGSSSKHKDLPGEPKGAPAIEWDPHQGVQHVETLHGVDAVVHLAGEPLISVGWSQQKMQRIRDSRVTGTRTLAESIARVSATERPRALVCASAIGFYGSRGDEVLTEDSASGSGFLADVCREWESAADPAREAGVRVVHMRLGIVLDPRGGAMALMLPAFRLGGGGVVGSGRQWMSWISLDDAAGAMHEAIMNEHAEGPINLTAPDPITNREFTKTLGRVLHRPTIVPIPEFAVRLALGRMADEALLASVRAVPERLKNLGYTFRDPELESTLVRLLGRR